VRSAPAVPSTLAALGAVVLLVGAFPAACMEPPSIAAKATTPAPATRTPLDTGEGDTDAAAPAPSKPHRFAVAAENPTASRIAMDVLQKGGSAADAAIAGVLAVGVTQPVSSGLGGGGFAVVWDAQSKNITVLDFRETAPIGLRPSDYRNRSKLPESKHGVMFGVPGEVAGLVEIHKRWGKLAFADLVRGAADAAENGFPLSAHMARALQWNEAWVRKTPRFGMFAPGGKLAAPRDMIKNPALAATLRRIGAEGKSAFYEGAIAKDILETATGAGSRITAKELQSYRLIERGVLHTAWEGYDVFTMPLPSAGGLMVLETLHMHRKADLLALGYGSGAYLHLLAETFRGAVADRVRFLGDPAFVKADVEALASPARMQERRSLFSDMATTPAEKFPVSEAGTSHLVAIDEQGNMVSITSTVNNMFGCKLVTAGGFVLNDELDDFTRDTLEKRFAIPVGKGPNSPRGGARPTSSMTPTIVMQGGSPVFALGGSGGLRIATGTTQVLLAHLVFGRTPEQAVADPRLDTPPTGGLFLDPSAAPDVVTDLQKRGEVVETTKPNFSAVQAIAVSSRRGSRTIEAAGDPRKGGSGLVE
jgi:gamma-glutamyltranspeptidase/glutathione hydrolase